MVFSRAVIQVRRSEMDGSCGLACLNLTSSSLSILDDPHQPAGMTEPKERKTPTSLSSWFVPSFPGGLIELEFHGPRFFSFGDHEKTRSCPAGPQHVFPISSTRTIPT